jgi:flagellar motor switch protein FliG
MPGSSRSNDRLRQAAILVSSLDRSAAMAVLKQLPPQQAEQIVKLIDRLPPVSAAERERVLSQWRRSIAPSVSPASPEHSAAEAALAASTESFDAFEPSTAYATGAATEHSPSGTAAGPNPPLSTEHNRSPSSRPTPANPTPALGSWQSWQPAQLAELLSQERPIVVAVVVSQIDAGSAQQLLSHLPPALALEALEAMTRIASTDRTILEEIEQHLTQRLADYSQTTSLQQAGHQRLRAILMATPAELRQQWEKTLIDSPLPLTRLRTSLTELEREAALGATMLAQPTTPAAPHETVSGLAAAPSAQSRTPATALWPREAQEAIEANDLAAQLHSDSPAMPTDFEELSGWPSERMLELIHACQPQAVLTALSGSGHQLLARIAELVSRRDMRRLEQRLRKLGTISPARIEAARQHMLAVARQLQASPTPATHHR